MVSGLFLAYPPRGDRGVVMHEGKHGILDGVDDIDDVFGTKEEHAHKEEHGHEDKHDKKKEDEHKPHSHGCGCNCG